MPKVNVNCLGCGVFKQTENENLVGFVKDLSHDYCLDCFKLKNYGKTNVHYNPNVYDEIKPGSVIFVVHSVMQLDSLFNLPVERIQSDATFVYLINQVDLLPSETNLNHLFKEIKSKAKKQKIKIDELILMSALNKEDINNLKGFIKSYQTKNFYLFGYQNSGKSTLFKALTNNNLVLSINKAGLTQSLIEGNYEDKKIYDLPGVYIKGILANYFNYEEYKVMLPSVKLKPRVYVLTNKQRLVLNNLIEITNNNETNVTLIFYINQQIVVKRYNVNNELDYLNNDFKYISKTFKTIYKKNHVQISDLGFILINGLNNINIKHPKEMHLTIMESLIK